MRKPTSAPGIDHGLPGRKQFRTFPAPGGARACSEGVIATSHGGLATRHLGLRAFVPAYDMRTPMDLTARAAFDTDDGRISLARLTGGMKAHRLV